MKNPQSDMPTILVIFGATGDLTARKLVPALFELYRQQLLSPLLQVIGFARRDISQAEWREQVRNMCSVVGADQEQLVEEFSQLFYYQSGQFDESAGYEALAKTLGKQDEDWKTCANKLFYLAVAPHFYKTILQKLADSKLTEPCSPEEGWTRVLVEKPFGHDLASAEELDGFMAKLFKEEQIYRIDHYLGKETVQNILAFRFSNAFLEPAWDNRSIESMSFTFHEELGVDGRGEFYDATGALRDVGQNHLLQLVALFMMENPGEFSAPVIRKKRQEILEALQLLDENAVATQTVRGQYDDYKLVKGVDTASEVETFFRVQASVENARWHGVPIYIEGGKKLNESFVEVVVTFRHQMPCLCPPETKKHYKTILRYRIQPKEGVRMSFWVKKPGAGMVIEEKDFAFDYQEAFGVTSFLDPYAKLFLDTFMGDQTLFVSTDEILASWKFIDPIELAWAKNVSPLLPYQSGSGGPEQLVASEHMVKGGSLGYVGLGKMGLNMVSRLTRFGWNVVATDPDAAARDKAVEAGAQAVMNAREVVASLEGPKTIWLMVPHQAVDDVLADIVPQLQAGDTVIDGGNSFYKDSVRRAAELQGKGIHFLDAGVSGGPSGARVGACLMVGGDQVIFTQHEHLFRDLATRNGYAYMGKAGSGHFVKMVHNGIEYGMMQAIGEGFAVMKKSEFGIDLEKVASLFNHGSVIESRLVVWLKEAYANYGEELPDISGAVAASGEGKWTVEAAQELGIPVPVIESALQFRTDSQDSPSYTGQIVSALRNQFGGHNVKKDGNKG